MLTLHFLNVGHGDCTFVDLHSGRLMMIDINNSKSLPDADILALAEHKGISVQSFKAEGLFTYSWEQRYRQMLVDPYDYYREHFRGRSVFRYVQTHPDMDHMSGLHRFFWQEQVPLENFWDVDHNRRRDRASFDNGRDNWDDWLTYGQLRKGKGSGNSTHKVIRNLRDAEGQYWSEDRIEVLSPTDVLIRTCNTNDDYNDCSYVLKITHAGRSVILAGDAEGPAWASILEALGPEALACDVLKA